MKRQRFKERLTKKDRVGGLRPVEVSLDKKGDFVFAPAEHFAAPRLRSTEAQRLARWILRVAGGR